MSMLPRVALEYRHVCQDFLSALDDKCGLVVYSILFANLLQIFILLNRMCEDRVANVFCRLISMVTNYPFKLNAVLLIAAIVNPVCIQEEDVSGTHERDFCHV